MRIVAKIFVMPRVRISNQTLNSYGTRVMTAGIDLERYNQNPVLLYMHQRGDVIGTVEDIKVEGEDLTGELKFDEASELSIRVKKQFEAGSLRMVSAGLIIVEMSSEAELLVQGQTSPTVTKSQLREVSVVDIGANPDAIRLYNQEEKQFNLGTGGDNPLPLLNINNNQNVKDMDLKQIALQLGMPETATEAEVLAKITQLNAQSAELTTLKDEMKGMRLSAITAAVETAISEKRLAADKKDQFIALGEKIGLEDLNKTLSSMNPTMKLSEQLTPGAGEQKWEKLKDVPSDKLMQLRDENPKEYKRLFKNEYGYDCEL